MYTNGKQVYVYRLKTTAEVSFIEDNLGSKITFHGLPSMRDGHVKQPLTVDKFWWNEILTYYDKYRFAQVFYILIPLSNQIQIPYQLS